MTAPTLRDKKRRPRKRPPKFDLGNDDREEEPVAESKIPLGRFFRSKSWGNRQIELLLLQDGSPSYFVGDPQGLKENWSEIRNFDHVYFGLNPSNVGPGNRNRISKGSIGRNARSITRIKFLYVDVDPIRPPEACATEEEKLKAKRVAVKIQRYLSGQGFPFPWIFDSGNGYHLLYACDIPIKHVGLTKRFIGFLAERFDTGDIKVDRAVGDLARVCRLPFTWNSKGDDTTERPHRKSEIIKAPSSSGAKRLVTRDRLVELLGSGQGKRTAESSEEASVGEPTRPEVISPAGKYVSKMSPSIQRKNGSGRLYAAACKAYELGCNRTEARLVIERDFNPRCEPPWSPQELDHKLDDAWEKVNNASGTVATVKQVPRSQACNFEFGFVPDWAYFCTAIKDQFKMYGSSNSRTLLLEHFCLMQFKQPCPVVPQEYVRQFFAKYQVQQNWRSRLPGKIGRNWKILDSYRAKKTYSNCTFCSQGFPPHTHFSFSAETPNSLLPLLTIKDLDGKPFFTTQSKAGGSLESVGRSYLEQKGSFLCFSSENRKLVNQLRKSGKIRKAYWPMLLLGWEAGLTRQQIRALLGITWEQTRNSDKQTLIISEGIVPIIGKTQGRCPLLEKSQDYVVFGGNRKDHRGEGYSLYGRTQQGWMKRFGFTEAYDRKGDCWRQDTKSILDVLSTLPAELGLIVGAYKKSENKWKGLGDLIKMYRSEAGFRWIENSTIRFYAPTDWCDQWRDYLSKQLGYTRIPCCSAECSSHARHDAVSQEELRSFIASEGLSLTQLAQQLTSVGGEVSYKKIQRYMAGTTQTSELRKLLSDFVRSR